ncbi:MAG: NAD(P)/FAD-dependent oxidoreductase [Turneriella sp.]
MPKKPKLPSQHKASYDAIVIGAGCGGTTAAALLAKNGYDVLLLEQSSLIGGCCSTAKIKGYNFDLGASIIEDADVIDEVFGRLGTSLAKEVKLVPCEPVYDCMLSDGSRVQIPTDIEATVAELAKVSPADAKRFRKYVKKFRDFTETALKGFFVMPARGLIDMAKIFMRTPGLLKFGGLFVGSYEGALRKFFKERRVLESMSFQSFYVGLPPELAPAYFAMLAYSEHRGVYYTKGGMGQIPEAIVRVGKSHGLELRQNTRVKRILLTKRKVQGVELSDGTRISAPIVISGINAKQMYKELIGHENLPWLVKKGLDSYEYSMATPMIYLGLDYKPPLKAHHTLVTIPTEEMNRYWDEKYLKGEYSEKQFGIISWTTKSDPSLAPKGHHIIILTLAPGPYKLKDKNWDDIKKDLMKRIIDYYSEKYLPGLKDHVKVAEFATPLDFERRLLSPEGAIYALRQDFANASMFRPSAKSKSIQGLYLVGASTHPGGGVPTTMCSGMIGADLVMKYQPKEKL